MIENLHTDPSTFRSIVELSIKRFDSQRRPWYTEFSQAVNLESLNVGEVFRDVINCMPDYVPAETVERIRTTHAEPRIVASVLRDKRQVNAEVVFEVIVPDRYANTEYEGDWRTGIGAINEIANDTLALDVIEKMARVGPETHKLMAGIMSVMNGKMQAYKNSYESMESIFGEDFERFRQSLVVGSLSGKHDDINEILVRYGFEDIDDLAVKLSQRVYGHSHEGASNSPISRTRALFSGGEYLDQTIPGVIEMHVGSSLPSLALDVSMASYISSEMLFNIKNHDLVSQTLLFGGLLFSFGGGVRKVFNIPRHLIHEICHYLGHDTDHSGLLRMKMRDNVDI